MLPGYSSRTLKSEGQETHNEFQVIISGPILLHACNDSCPITPLFLFLQFWLNELIAAVLNIGISLHLRISVLEPPTVNGGQPLAIHKVRVDMVHALVTPKFLP
jgi:hypothetical protein